MKNRSTIKSYLVCFWVGVFFVYVLFDCLLAIDFIPYKIIFCGHVLVLLSVWFLSSTYNDKKLFLKT